MKTPISLFYCFLVFTLSSNAQILVEKNKLIEEYGPGYTTETSDNGSDFLSYEKVEEGLLGDIIIKTTLYYFIKYNDGTDVCSHVKIILPSSETPFYLLWLNDKMEYLGNLKWKDPESEYSYKAQIIEPFMALTIWIDREGLTETFKETKSFSKTYNLVPHKY